MISRYIKALAAMAVALSSAICSATTQQPSSSSMDNQTNETCVAIETTEGTVVVRLYDDTPLHRDNFIKLASEGYYDGLLFHRVISDFVVQGGDPFSRSALPGQLLGDGGPGYTIEAEIDYPNHFHKRGALAAAREDESTNPERRSGGSQFYIVTGKVYNAGQISSMEQSMTRQMREAIRQQIKDQYRDSISSLRRARNFSALTQLQNEITEKTDSAERKCRFRMPDNVREAYMTVGGTPHLDSNYTVFGEVVSGMDVIDKISAVEVDGNKRPVEDIRIISTKVIAPQQ